MGLSTHLGLSTPGVVDLGPRTRQGLEQRSGSMGAGTRGDADAEMTMNEPETHDASPPTLYRDPLVLSDCYLLTAESGGNVAVPGLTVVLDRSGLTVRKPDGDIGAVVAWADISGLVASERMRTPAGHPGVIVEAVTPSRTHRFVVPSDNPEGLEYEVGQLAGAAIAESPAPAPGRNPRSGVLVGACAVLGILIIALGVLVATGTVKF